MPISYVGSAGGTNTVTFPSFQTGDIAIAWAFRAATTAPTTPANWTSLAGFNGTSSSLRVAWRRLTAGATAGTFTNATRMCVGIWRGCEPFITPTGGGTQNSGTTTTLGYSAVTMTRGDSTSWVAAGVGISVTTSDLEVPPTGMTNRFTNATTAEMAIHDTNGGVASWSLTNKTLTAAGNWCLYVVELLALPTQTPCELILPPTVKM